MLINAIATMPFAALLERTARRKPLIVGSLALLRLGRLALIAIPVALFTAGWLPLLAEIIPLRRRARLLQPQYHAWHHGDGLHLHLRALARQ